MTTASNGAHVAECLNCDPDGVPCCAACCQCGCEPPTFLDPDPLTVIPDEPCHTTGRAFPQPILRQLLRSMGVLTDCHRFTGMAPRQERNLRPKGTGWRERP